MRLQTLFRTKLATAGLLASLCACFVLSSQPSFANGCGAGVLRERLRALAEELPPAFDRLQEIEPELVRGERTPKWDDFDRLERIITALQESKKTAIDAGKIKEWRATFRAIQKSLSEFPELEALQKVAKMPKEKGAHKTYLPSEYELKQEYQLLLSELNHELPPGLRIKGIMPPKSGRLPRLLVQAKELLKKQEERFVPFFSDSGFSDSEALRKALHEYSPQAGKLADNLANEKVELAMNRPEGARWWVPKVGFQNQRTTGSSRGMFSPEYRNQVEAKLTGQNSVEYAASDDQFKPVYGYLKPKPSNRIKQANAANGYGPDTYVFKNDRVTDRLTWTPCDSFGVQGYAAESPGAKPTNWKGFFIPWKNRLLIAPDLLESLESSREGFEVGTKRIRLSGKVPKEPIAPPAPPYPAYFHLVKDFTEPTIDLSRLPPPAKKPPEPVNGGIFVPTPPAPLPLPKQPLMPVLKTGESFDVALLNYKNSKERKDYEVEAARIDALNKEQQNEFLKSEPCLEYQRQSQAALEDYVRRHTAYLASPEYLNYVADVKKIEDAKMALQTALEQTDSWKEYKIKQAQYNLKFEEKQKEWNSLVAAYKAKQKLYLASEPYLAHKKRQKAWNRKIDKLKSDDLYRWGIANQEMDPSFGFHGTSLANFRSLPTWGYVELQYWGPVTLDDVELFEFRQTPPSGEFLEQLKKRGIKIRDGRVDPAVEWKEGAP